MNKAMVIIGSLVVGLGVLTLVISIIGVADRQPQNNIIYTHPASSDAVAYEYPGDILMISVYSADGTACSAITVSITDSSEEWEYFEKDCDAAFNSPGYTYLGSAFLDPAGTYYIDSGGHELVLVDDSDVAFGGLGAIAGCGCLLLGMILLIVGLIIGGKQETQQVYVVQDADFLQHIQSGTPIQPGTPIQSGTPIQPATPIQSTQVIQQPAAQYQQQVIPPTTVIEQPSPVVAAPADVAPLDEQDAKLERYVQMLRDQGYPEAEAREHALKHKHLF